MHIRQIKPRFDQTTGKQRGTMSVTLHHRCDYCGEVLPSTEGSDCGYTPNLTLRFDYADSDPCFGSSGGEYAFSEKYGGAVFGQKGPWFDMGSFLGQPYSFCNDWNREGDRALCEQALALEFLAGTFDDMPSPQPPEGMTPLQETLDLQGALREARIRTASKLLASGVVTAEQLQPKDERIRNT